MKYIIHIGQSKTGTSSLQSFLAKNRQALADEGILFPDVYINETPLNMSEHNALADQLAGITRYPNLTAEAYFEQFSKQAQFNKAHTTIISGESFFSAPQIWRFSNEGEFWQAQKRKVQNLSSFINEEDEVSIIVYLKPQQDWFEGAVSQIIRTEGLLGHCIYERDEQLFDYLKPHMDYKRILDLWRLEFPKAKFYVTAFEKESLIQKNIIHDFCAKISLKAENLTVPVDNDNIGLDRRYIWLKQQLNQKKKSKTKERIIIALLTDLNKKVPHPKKYSLLPEFKRKIYDFYQGANKDMFHRYDMAVPNIFATCKMSKDIGLVTEAEKKEALYEYKKSFYSFRTMYLFCRYSVGAITRKYTPFFNAFLKKIFKI